MMQHVGGKRIETVTAFPERGLGFAMTEPTHDAVEMFVYGRSVEAQRAGQVFTPTMEQVLRTQLPHCWVHGQVVLVGAFENRQLRGLADLWVATTLDLTGTRREINLYGFVMDPEWATLGKGLRFFRACLETAQFFEVEQLTTHVFHGKNSPLGRFLLRCGGKAIGTTYQVPIGGDA